MKTNNFYKSVPLLLLLRLAGLPAQKGEAHSKVDGCDESNRGNFTLRRNLCENIDKVWNKIVIFFGEKFRLLLPALVCSRDPSLRKKLKSKKGFALVLRTVVLLVQQRTNKNRVSFNGKQCFSGILGWRSLNTFSIHKSLKHCVFCFFFSLMLHLYSFSSSF